MNRYEQIFIIGYIQVFKFMNKHLQVAPVLDGINGSK